MAQMQIGEINELINITNGRKVQEEYSKHDDF